MHLDLVLCRLATYDLGVDALTLLLRRHGPAAHYCWWNKYVANPIKAWGYSGKGRTAMRVLKVWHIPSSLQHHPFE